MISGLVQASQPRETAPTGRRWPIIVGCLLGGQFLICGAIIYLANADPSMAIEPQYYEKALHWDREAAQRQTNRRLGWRAAGNFDAQTLRLSLLDRDSRPIRNATIRAIAFAHRRSRERHELTFQILPNGEYAARVPVTVSGLWEFRLRAAVGSEEFQETLTIDVSSHAGAPR